MGTTSGYTDRGEEFEALREYFRALAPYGLPEDFGKGELPMPEPLQWLTSGDELQCFFRACGGERPETGEKTKRAA